MDTLERIKNLEKNINQLETIINNLVKENKELKTYLKEIYEHHARSIKCDCRA